MMKNLTFLFALFFIHRSYGQGSGPDLYGFRHLQTTYKGDTVDVLIKSKKGEEQTKKPLFLFCQGSQPIPLVITRTDSSGNQKPYNVFVFRPDSLANEYHLAIIGKPYVPLVMNEKVLSADLTYRDSTGEYPRSYIERNLLDYYVGRNTAVIKHLQKQLWISSERLVVAGHSEGSTIAAKLASTFRRVTHLIYSGGNSLGRMVSIVGQQRAFETDSTRFGEQAFTTWKNIVNNPNDMTTAGSDAYKTTYQFSVPPPIAYLEKLKIPVLITYGTKDYAGPFNDYFRIKTIEDKRTNFTFKSYIGLQHNFFPLKATGDVNYDVWNWDRVADDWRGWLQGR